MNRMATIVLTTIILAMLLVFPSPGVAGNPSSRGGSNMGWHYVEDDPAKPDYCDRKPYGIIANYHKLSVQVTVKEQLFTMRKKGQRKLRVPVLHRNMGDPELPNGIDNDGSVMNSYGGNLSVRMRNNLWRFLGHAKDKGFNTVVLAMFPVGLNRPYNWHDENDIYYWDEATYVENFSVVKNLRVIIKNRGFSKYQIDLGNEGIPQNIPKHYMARDYAQRMWAEYTSDYGRNDTVGFSIGGSSIGNKLAMLPIIYGSSYPKIMDIHLYESAYSKLVTLDTWLDINRVPSHIIVGETFYNDLDSKNDIFDAIDVMNKTVFYVLQWPQLPSRPCDQVSIIPTTEFLYFDEQ